MAESNELKSLTMNGKTYDSFPDKTAVKSVNGVFPDENGNVVIEVTGGNANVVEPADDDIPKVYFTGTLPTSKNDDDVRLNMRYISKTADFAYPVTLKVQGASSATHPKKNFTLKPYKDDTYESKKKLVFKNWPEMNKFVLKAHWVDHSHVRNVGTAKIWGKMVASRSDYDSLPEELRNAPNNGATDGFTVKVFCNGVYQGLYEWIVPKDKLFGQDSDITTHSILNSELNNQPTCAFATTSPTINGNWSEELQDSMTGETSVSFANLIKFVAGATDEDFVANAENYFDVQSVIDFDILARVFCIVDNLCRNQIFFTYDGVKWYEGCWDVDAVLGLHPTSGAFYAYNTKFQEGYLAYTSAGITNMLYKRVENLFAERFKARYTELRNGVLSADSIIDVYERLTDTIKGYDGLLEEDYAETTANGAFTGIPHTDKSNIQQIRNFIAARLPYMDKEVSLIGTPEEEPDDEIACTGIVLDKTSLTFNTLISLNLTATVTPTDTTDFVLWKSSDENVATVSYGVVTPVADGECTITATCGEYSATCGVTVSMEEAEVTLPDGYSRLKRLFFEGEQHFVTDIDGTSDIGIDTKVNFASLGVSTISHIAGFAPNHTLLAMRKNDSAGFLTNVTEGSKEAKTNFIPEVASDYVVTANVGNAITINGENKAVYNGGNVKTSNPVHLFCYAGGASNGTYKLKGFAYYVKLYNAGTKVLHYVPAYRNADGAVGMYDVVAGKFVESSGEAFTGAIPITSKTGILADADIFAGAYTLGNTFEKDAGNIRTDYVDIRDGGYSKLKLVATNTPATYGSRITFFDSSYTKLTQKYTNTSTVEADVPDGAAYVIFGCTNADLTDFTVYSVGDTETEIGRIECTVV